LKIKRPSGVLSLLGVSLTGDRRFGEEVPQEEVQDNMQDEEETRRSDELGEEVRHLQANDDHVKAQAVDKYEGSDKSSIDDHETGSAAIDDTVRARGDESLSLDGSQIKKEADANSSGTAVTDKTDNTNLISQLELTNEVKQQEIVISYVFDPGIDSLSIELNHKYGSKKIISPIESNWPKTIDTFEKQLQRKNVSVEHIPMLCDVADNADNAKL
jgi:hypothetical protein